MGGNGLLEGWSTFLVLYNSGESGFNDKFANISHRVAKLSPYQHVDHCRVLPKTATGLRARIL
jgi:hypothetical protein